MAIDGLLRVLWPKDRIIFHRAGSNSDKTRNGYLNVEMSARGCACGRGVVSPCVLHFCVYTVKTEPWRIISGRQDLYKNVFFLAVCGGARVEVAGDRREAEGQYILAACRCTRFPRQRSALHRNSRVWRVGSKRVNRREATSGAIVPVGHRPQFPRLAGGE